MLPPVALFVAEPAAEDFTSRVAEGMTSPGWS